MPHAVIAGASSGIGSALAAHLLGGGWRVSGTSRGMMPEHASGVASFSPCDFSDMESVDQTARAITAATPPWDLLVLAPGTMEPIGPFSSIDIDLWTRSLHVNLINQLRLVHGLLGHARVTGPTEPRCVFLAGGGTNSAPVAFSAYTISKIALIKAAELLDAENRAVIFTILGPGWVRTAIHEETLRSSAAPEAVVTETRRRLESGDFMKMDRVLAAFDWLLEQPRGVIGGRNFSVSGDPFESPGFAEFLESNPSVFKLRRYGNDAYWADHDQ